MQVSVRVGASVPDLRACTAVRARRGTPAPTGIQAGRLTSGMKRRTHRPRAVQPAAHGRRTGTPVGTWAGPLGQARARPTQGVRTRPHTAVAPEWSPQHDDLHSALLHARDSYGKHATHARPHARTHT